MAIETVTLMVGTSWTLLSAAAGPFKAQVRSSGQLLFFVGSSAPAADYPFGLVSAEVGYEALAAKVWARSLREPVGVTCLRTVDAGNTAETILPALTLSAISFAATVPAGAEIATIAGRIAGDAIDGLLPGDGPFVLNGDRTKLLRGLAPVVVGPLEVELVASHPAAPNSPRRTKLALTVTNGAGVLGPTAAAFTAGAASGTLIAAITGLGVDETIASVAPNDGRLALDANRRSLLVGLSASAAGTIAATLTTSAGRTLAMTLTVNASASVPVIFGLVTKTADGSVGQTYTGPAWASPQWYRETLASPKTRTAIAGATNRTYVAAAEDAEYRLVMGGLDGGVAKLASAYAMVKPAPVLFDAFDSTSGFTFSGEALTLDTTSKAQGTASLVLKDTGAQQRAIKSIGVQPDPATWGVVAVWNDTGTDPDYANRGPVSVGFANSGNPGGSSNLGSFGDGNANFKRFGKIWGSAHVSENATVAALGAGAKTMSTAVQTLPYGATVRVDAACRQAGGEPTICITGDDGFQSQYTGVYPALRDRGLKGTLFLPWGQIGLDGNRIDGRMLIQEVKEMYDSGVMAACLDGTPFDNAMTNPAINANAQAAADLLLQGRQWLVDRGLTGGAGGHGGFYFCYPNGSNDDDAAHIQIAALTGDGSNVVTAGAAPSSAPVVGMKFSGYGIPPNTFVTEIISTTQFRLSNNVPAQTKPAQFADTSGPFYIGKLYATLRAAGFRIGRGTQPGMMLTRFGFADQGINFLGQTTTGQTSQQMIDYTKLVQLRGNTGMVYMHNFDSARDLPWYDYLATEQNAGRLRVLTVPELDARDGGASFPA